jgi:hypothetical protein
MEDNIKDFTFDIDKELIQTISGQQGDTSRKIRFYLTQNSLPYDLTDCIVKIYLIKPDGNLVFNNTTIENSAQGKILVELTEQILAVQGSATCQLKIYGTDNTLISSSIFYVTIKQSLIDQVIASTSEFNALLDAIVKAENAADKTYVDTEIANKMKGGPKYTYANYAALVAAYPTGDSNNYLVAASDGVQEVDTLNITAVPTASGNITINLNGEVINVAVDTATDTTTDLVAAKIRGITFIGWTTGGTGASVTFTKNTVGVNTAPSFSGGTTGTTATIAVTTAGEPSRTGDWYYWNGSAWIDGGVYQNAVIADGVLSKNKLSETIINVLNEATNAHGKTLNSSGQLVANATYQTTDFIPVKNGDTVYSSQAFDKYSLYDSNGNHIQYYSVAWANSFVVTLANASYAKMSYADTATNVMITKNYPLPTNYLSPNNAIINWLKVLGSQLDNKSIDETKIVDNTITKNLMKDSIVNFLNEATNTHGQVLQSNGSLATNATYQTTDFIPVKNGDVIYISQATNVYCVYDSNHSIIQSFFPSWITTFTITNINAAYVRISYADTAVNRMLTKNYPLPSFYMPYGKAIIDWLFPDISKINDNTVNASKLVDKSIDETKIKNSSLSYKVLQNAVINVFNSANGQSGKLSRSGGVTTIATDANWWTSEKLDIKQGDVINWSKTGEVYEVLDASGNTLAFGVLDWSTATLSITWANASKIWFSVPVNTTPKEQQMAVINYSVPSVFLPYGKAIIDWLVVGLDYPTIYSQMQALSPKFDETKDRILLPPTMYFVDDLPLPIYKESIFSTVDDLNLFDSYLINVKPDNTPEYRSFLHDTILDATKLSNQFKIAIHQKTNFNYDYFSLINKSVVTSSSNNGKSIKYNAWGDSLTQNGVPSLVKDLLATYGVTCNLIGTTPLNSPFVGNTEGRSGWSFRNFIGMGYKYPNGVDTIPYNIMTFLRLATDTDKTNHPTWCFRRTGALKELSYQDDTDKTGDFYIFDYANYLTVNSLPTPDVVTIGLSRNDLLNYPSSESVVGCRLGLEIMIKQIKTAFPNMKIGIIPSTVWQDHSDYNSKWIDIVSTWIEDCMTDIKLYQQTYNNLYIIPSWAHMNKRFSWTYASQADLSSVNQTQKALLGDHLHYGDLGRAEDRNVITSFIMNVI